MNFDGAKPVGRARVLPPYAHVYPGVDRDRWYDVLPHDGKFGAYINDDRFPRCVTKEHFEIVVP